MTGSEVFLPVVGGPLCGIHWQTTSHQLLSYQPDPGGRIHFYTPTTVVPGGPYCLVHKIIKDPNRYAQERRKEQEEDDPDEEC